MTEWRWRLRIVIWWYNWASFNRVRWA